MFLLDHSQAIFYLALAVCVLWLTVFASLLLYHVLAAVRQLHQAARSVRERIEDFSGLWRQLHLALAVPGVAVKAVTGLWRQLRPHLAGVTENKTVASRKIKGLGKTKRAK